MVRFGLLSNRKVMRWPRPSAVQPSKSRSQADWHRIFERSRTSIDYIVDEVEGQLPAGLVGTLYRNGPGKNEVGGKPYAHLFDGDGMLSQFMFDGDKRPLREPVRAHDALPGRACGRQAACCAATVSSAPAARWATLPHAGERRQHERPRTTRVTCSPSRKAGVRGSSIPTRSRHRRVRLRRRAEEPLHVLRPPDLGSGTGELYNFGIQYGRRTKLRTYRVDARGQLHHLQPVTPAVRDHQPRLRADAQVHGLRDRPAGRAGAAVPARSRQPRQVACASTARRRRRSSWCRATAASRASPSASRSSTTTSTTPTRTATRRRARPRALPRLRQHPPQLPQASPAGFDDVSTGSAGCGSAPSGEVDDRGPVPGRLRVPAARLAAHELGRIATPTWPAGRPDAARRALRRDHEDRPRARRHRDPRLRRRARSRASRSSCRALPTAARTTAGCSRSSTRLPSTARGWSCSTRATSSRSRSRSRTCATTSRSASTARSRRGLRRRNPAEPALALRLSPG